MLNQVRPAATEPSVLLSTGKGILLFVFVITSFPMLVLKFDELGRFYEALLGIKR